MRKIIIIAISVLLISCNKREIREVKDPISGQVLEQFQVKENKEGSFLKDGFYKSWYNNGQIECNGNYSVNKKTGLWNYWYSSGQIKSEYSFKEDSLNGDFKKWYENAQLKIEGKYDFGNLIGEWTSYHDNGQVSAKEYYTNDLREGHFTTWYSNGQKESEGDFLKNEMEGTWTFWDQDGVLNKQAVYKHGKNIILVGGKWVDKDKDEWQFFEDGSYILTIKKSGTRKKGNWEIDTKNLTLDSKNLKLKFISKDSVYASRWVSDWWYGNYEAQRLQAVRINDSIITQ